MGRLDTGGDGFFDLGVPFAEYFVRVGRGILLLVEGQAVEAAVSFCKRFVTGEQRPAAGQGKMDADAEGGHSLGELYGVVKGGHTSHDGGRGQNTTQMAFLYPKIDAVGQPEIICIKDQFFQCAYSFLGLGGPE